MGKLIDLVGKRFGRLFVEKRGENRNGKVYWQCLCDCGNRCEVRGDQLTRNKSHSCGCLIKEAASIQGKNNFKDLSGQRFGKLVVLSSVNTLKNHKYVWKCKCDCGNIIEIVGTSLTSGNARSCGCLKSIGETNINLLLTKEHIEYVTQYCVIINGEKRYYDFALIQNNKPYRFIEFDGIQHFGRVSGWFTEERKNQLEKSDQDKNEYALSNHIPLIRIPYWERDNITIDMILNNQYLITTNNDTE